jgi:hypothetical protein
MAPAAAPEAAFKKDEKVFCFHHELLYEAKILEARPVEEDKKNGFEYRVHYKGWKNTYVPRICLSLRLLARRFASHCGSHVCPGIHFKLSSSSYTTGVQLHDTATSCSKNPAPRFLTLRPIANALQLGRLGS